MSENLQNFKACRPETNALAQRPEREVNTPPSKQWFFWWSLGEKRAARGETLTFEKGGQMVFDFCSKP